MTGTNIAASDETERAQAHAALSRLARERAAADAGEGRWLLAALRSAAHVHLGYGSFGEHVERLFGYKPREPSGSAAPRAALRRFARNSGALP